MIVGKYILLFTCLGIGVALCVGAISILRSPPDNGPPAWFAAVLGAMFFWGAFALSGAASGRGRIFLARGKILDRDA
jgi:hypothetical protein